MKKQPWIPRVEALDRKERVTFVQAFSIICCMTIKRMSHSAKELFEENVHICSIIPPRYSVEEIVGVLRSVGAREIFLRYPEVNRGGFWEVGYFVRTIRDRVTSETIENCIRYHTHEQKKC